MEPIRFPTANLYDRDYVRGFLDKNEEALLGGLLKVAPKAQARDLLTKILERAAIRTVTDDASLQTAVKSPD